MDSDRLSLLSRWPGVVAIALAATLVAVIAGHRLEPVAGDILLTKLLPAKLARDDIVIVAIDEETLEGLTYRSPIDRGLLADIVAHVDKAGARAIGLDILIDQASEPEKDALLLTTLEQAHTPLIAGRAGTREGLTQAQERFAEEFLAPLKTASVALARDEIDGTIRRLPQSGESGETFSRTLAISGGEMPENLSDRIVYFTGNDGRPHAFPTYPAHAAALLPPDWFAGKYVLIGTKLATSDRHKTPFSAALGAEAGLLNGIEIHAHMLAQYLEGRHIAILPRLAETLIAAAMALLGAALVALRASPALRVAGVAGLVALYFGACFAALQWGETLLPLVMPPLAAVIAGAAMGGVHWFQDRAERKFVEQAFSRYVSPALVKRLVSDRKALSLGGEKREVTFVFTDLEGFTSVSEKLAPAEVADLLNGYLDKVCERFIAHGATIDKIVGDSVVGFFGAPEPQDDQACRAVDLVLELDRLCEKLKEEASAKGVALGLTRIGVHKGEAIVGNFGGSRFFDYTGIGDTVNTASRLEAANKHLGTRVLVSRAVADACPEHAFRPAATLVLKGKSEGVDCFVPLMSSQANSEAITAYREAYRAMSENSGEAETLLAKALEICPGDPLARYHLARLRRGKQGTTIELADE
ncbi:CHASE2 domain-containing protein [Stappia sp. GBMRC 2046]|uniref:CHASE2 domain-containing protein n=1 Tax=Stappia sediminis TaxID=2692190 RepID=A0A7X3LUR8_9HYPH|nr:CHASE2 domain-containing protein [Stappia sediminis]MXN65471.1 CHASE2 domain-containing protein [Stappia sediminis]